jgi:hypothetical protein
MRITSGKIHLHDAELDADRYWFEGHGHPNFPRQIRDRRTYPVADALIRREAKE